MNHLMALEEQHIAHLTRWNYGDAANRKTADGAEKIVGSSSPLPQRKKRKAA